MATINLQEFLSNRHLVYKGATSSDSYDPIKYYLGRDATFTACFARPIQEDAGSNYGKLGKDESSSSITSGGRNDIVAFDFVKQFLVMGLGVLESDSDGRYFFEYSLPRNADVVSSINLQPLSNVKIELSYYINRVKYLPQDIDEFVMVSAPYTEFKIRFTFLEPPTITDKFILNAKYYLFSEAEAKVFRNQENRIVTRNNYYTSGMFHAGSVSN